jgi:outer membrane receptor for ferrienterochelin and colicins
MRKITLSLLGFSTFFIAQAQNFTNKNKVDTNLIKSLDEVVVTGQYKPQSARNSVYQVRVISAARIRQQGATQLQDVLKNELNIRFSQDLATGGSNITMLGLKGQNVKILVDGLPLIGRQGTSNEIDLNQIDINSIEKIELVEGPMSVVFGADALAGVVNIITKKSNNPGLNIYAGVREETVGKEYGTERGIHNQQFGANWKKGKMDASASFAHNYFGGWKDTAIGRELVWHKKDQRLASGSVGYSNGKFNIRYRLDGLDEIITNPGNFQPFAEPSSGDTLAYDQQYLVHRLMQQLQSSYFVNKKLNIQSQAAFTDYSRQVFSTTLNKTTGDVRLNIAEGAQSTVKFTGFTYRLLSNYRLNDQISVQPGIDLNIETGKGERLKPGKNQINDLAFFVTSEFTPVSKLSIRPGVRLIRNSVYKAPPAVPSLNVKYVLGKNLDWRLSYARGFRSPSLRELYFNFFDINHQVLGNPNLKAETSNSFTTSFNWRKVSAVDKFYTATLNGFYNKVNNMIDYLYVPGSDTAVLGNILNSRTAGTSFNNQYQNKNWLVSVGFGLTGFYNDLSAEDKTLPELQWSAEATTSVNYKIASKGIDLAVYYKLTGRRPYYTRDITQELILSQLKAFQLCDFTATKSIKSFGTVQAGVRNIFNVDRIRSTYAREGVHTGNGITNLATGRSYFIALNYNWSKK